MLFHPKQGPFSRKAPSGEELFCPQSQGIVHHQWASCTERFMEPRVFLLGNGWSLQRGFYITRKSLWSQSANQLRATQKRSQKTCVLSKEISVEGHYQSGGWGGNVSSWIYSRSYFWIEQVSLECKAGWKSEDGATTRVCDFHTRSLSPSPCIFRELIVKLCWKNKS